jgi:hypothetical protein
LFFPHAPLLWASQLQQFGCVAKGNSVMTPPHPGTFASLARNMFRGPGLEAWHLSLLKDWKPAERAKIQFRAEFFKVLNQPNFANPYGANFTYAVEWTLRIRRNLVAGPRNVQLGMKVIF